MDCPQNILLKQEMLPILIPTFFVLLACVTLLVGYLVYQDIAGVLKRRKVRSATQLSPVYNVVYEAQAIASLAYSRSIEQEAEKLAI